MNLETIQLTDNKAIHNFELLINGQRAFIDYKTKDNKIYLIHTEVPPALQGMGVAEALVEKAFYYIEQQGQKIVPLCTYVKLFLKRHPHWQKLLA